MKILHVTPYYRPAYRYGGPVRSVHGSCRALARQGCEVHVLTTNRDGPATLAVPVDQPVVIDGVTVWYFPSPVLRRTFFAPRMAGWLRRHLGEFDLLHCHAVYLWPTWAAARWARKQGLPYLVSPHGMLVQELVRKRSRLKKRLWIHLVEKHNLRGAAAVQVTGETEKNALLEFGFDLPEVVVVPHGVDLEPEAGDGGAPAGDLRRLAAAPYILFLGRLHRVKGLDRLIRAMPRVRANLVVAGMDDPPYRRELERLAGACGVSARVRFCRYVDGADKQFLLRHAALFVTASYSENFCLAALEAMAAGCPVVLTPEVGLAAFVRELGGGRVVPGDPETLGRAVQELLNRPAELERLGREAVAVVRNHFAWDRIAARQKSLYERLSAVRPE